MKNFNTNTKNDDQWLTPPALVQDLGPFDLDPCAPVRRPWPTAAQHYTVHEDGLSQPWFGRVWLNPPYGTETFRWLERLADHKNGLALIFARTETRGFHATVLEKAELVFFFKGRLRFCRVDGSSPGAANAPSCLVAYDWLNAGIVLRVWKAGRIHGRPVWI